MVRRVYIIPISGSQENAQLNAERSRIGNIFNSARQKVILCENTEAGESTVKVFTGISTFAGLESASNEALKIETNATTPLKVGGKAVLSDADWVDYSSTSTVTGWTSFTNKLLRYKTVGKIQFWRYEIEGTSNATSVSFTIPNTSASTLETRAAVAYWIDNGTVFSSNNASLLVGASSTTVEIYRGTAGTWTNSGSKGVRGQFFIELP